MDQNCTFECNSKVDREKRVDQNSDLLQTLYWTKIFTSKSYPSELTIDVAIKTGEKRSDQMQVESGFGPCCQINKMLWIVS